MGTLTIAGLIVRLSVLTLLLLLSALFSATETAFTSLSFLQASQIATKSARGRLIKQMKDSPDNMLTTILLGNNLVNFAASSLAVEFTTRMFSENAVVIMVPILTLIVLIFSEVTPKRIALVHNEWVAKRTVYTIWFLSMIFRPFLWFIQIFSRILSRPFAGKENKNVSMEGILHMMSMAENIGVVEKYEKSMVRNVFQLNDVPVEAIMTHRQDIFSLPEEMTLQEAVLIIKENHFSRIPLYREEAEHITGIVLEKELLKASLEGHGAQKLKKYMHKPAFISEAKKLDELFQLFKTNHLKMAVILDEYGGLAGIVTQEDMIEEIFGDLYDENEEREDDLIEKTGKESWRIKGETPIHTVRDETGLPIPEGKYSKTIAGFILEKLEEIPLEGTTLNLKEAGIYIEKMDRHRIASILLFRYEKQQ